MLPGPMSLCRNIQMEGSEFGMNNMKASIHPAVSRALFKHPAYFIILSGHDHSVSIFCNGVMLSCQYGPKSCTLIN